MPDHLKQILAAIAGFPVVWFFSLLLHAVDANIGSAGGLITLATTLSVWGLSVFLFIPCLVALYGFWVRGVRVYMVVLLGTIILVGFWLTLGGSTASTFWGYIISFGGVVLVSAIFLVFGTLPSVLCYNVLNSR